MAYFAGLDVSVKETSICIVDDAGNIVREARVASEPEALLQVLTKTIYRFKRVGLEAGPLSQCLYSVLAEAGLPVICVETRHMRAMLKAQINKTDRNDARGIAQMTGGTLSCGACEDVTQPEASGAADPSQAASVEDHRHGPGRTYRQIECAIRNHFVAFLPQFLSPNGDFSGIEPVRRNTLRRQCRSGGRSQSTVMPPRSRGQPDGRRAMIASSGEQIEIAVGDQQAV